MTLVKITLTAETCADRDNLYGSCFVNGEVSELERVRVMCAIGIWLRDSVEHMFDTVGYGRVVEGSGEWLLCTSVSRNQVDIPIYQSISFSRHPCENELMGSNH
jgi:hypothetical protein